MLKAYIGAKIIKGEPMSSNDFKDKYKKSDYMRDSIDKEGYHVVYPDDYHSWSPKEVFENAYRELIPGEVDAVIATRSVEVDHAKKK